MASLQKCVAKFPEQPWSMSFAVWVGVKKLFQKVSKEAKQQRRELQLHADSPGPFAKHKCHPCSTQIT